MGKLAYRHQVSMWLASLRKVGGFRDEVILVTDRPACLATTLREAKLLGPAISSNDAVDIYGPAEGYEGNIHMVKRPHTGNINKMKQEKARAWLNMKVAQVPHPVSSIIYTDEDIIIGQNLGTFMSHVRSLEGRSHTLALFRDTGKSAGELHTGVVVMFPGKQTDECLQAWAKHLTGNKIGSAQFMEEVATEEALEDAPERPELTKIRTAASQETETEVEIEEGAMLKEEMESLGPDQHALVKTGACR